MNDAEARAIILDALVEVAPEIDPAALDADTGLRDSADLDSMDFLAYVSVVSEAIGADIPEDDYARLDTVNAATAYLVERLGT